MPRAAFDRQALVASVQRNCDLADARHADGRSLCTYLLGMRELFRWETGLPLGAMPERAALAGWLSERERRWEALSADDAVFARLPVAGGLDPFDDAAANEDLIGRGLVYGAGIGLFGAPLFFLAECRSATERNGARVLVAGDELARGIVAAPAASRGATIVIRLDALRRWLWTRFEVARRGNADTAFAAALRCHGDPADPAAVDRLARAEVETLILHELGELRAATLLGGDWEVMLAGVVDRRTELIVRAVRDLLADCLVTLPTLVDRRADGSLHFWRASFDGLRREIARPLVASFGNRAGTIDLAAVDAAAAEGRQRWHDVAIELLEAWRAGGQPQLRDRAAALAGGA